MLRLLQHPVVLVALCLSLVGTPVTYRGGASDAHPHMFFEFLLDAAAGSFAHHHHGSDAASAADSTHGDGHDHTHAHDENGSQPSEPEPAQPVADQAERFGPTLSAFVVGDVGQLASIVPQQDLPLSGDVATAFHPADVPPAGRTHAPTAPPPR